MALESEALKEAMIEEIILTYVLAERKGIHSQPHAVPPALYEVILGGQDGVVG